MTRELIAVVGRGCVLPDALDPDAFWDNILSGRSSPRPVPATKWRVPTGLVVGDCPDATDRAWTDVGGHVDGFSAVFDPYAYRLSADLVTALDPVFQWSLHGAGQALREAGQDSLLERAGLVLGNLSYPSTGLAAYAESVWRELGSPKRSAGSGERPHPYNRFSSGLPAHLTAKGLGLGLGGFAVDAACASSLYTIALACRRLQRGQADLMVAGGVNAADGLFLQMGFSTLSALSRSGRSRPFHRAADGLVPAEGAAFVALMRLSDAIAADVRVLGVIRGVGLSNDGRKSGPLVPSVEGQHRAMIEAYRAAGVSPDSVGLLEGHATGTAIGDAVEIRSTARVFADASDLPIGSVKSNIGHTVTAAGAAGLLKVLGALHDGVRPATLGAEVPSPEFTGTPLRLLQSAEEWTGRRRAAVSAFGFGGNNAHLIVDAWNGDGGGFVAEPLQVAGSTRPNPTPTPIAVVAVGSRVADGEDANDLRRSLLLGTSRSTAMDTVEVDLRGLRFPPLDLEEARAQQVLVLEAAREAAASTTLPRDSTMVLIGMGCDPEVARHVARWRVPVWLLTEEEAEAGSDLVRRLRDAIAPPQTAAAVLGAMPNMVANRVNQQLDLAGPSFTVSAEESSGVVALELGVDALRAGEADAVLAGAVDLSHEPVHQAALAALGHTGGSGDAAIVVVLKRLADARSAGDTVLAVLDEDDTSSADLTVGDARTPPPGDHVDPGELFGRAHAASGLLSVAVAALALHHRARPRADAPAVPMFDAVTALCDSKPLEGLPVRTRLRAADSAGLADTPPSNLRVYSGRDRSEVLVALAAERESAEGPARLVLWATEADGFAALVPKAARWLRGEGAQPVGAAFRERPVTGDIAFVYAGGSMAYSGMGRELMLAFPEQLDGIAERCGPLRDIVGWAFDGDESRPRHPLDQIGAAAVLGQLHTGITRDLMGLQPQAALGYSSGESSALASLGVWRDVSPLLTGARESELFTRLVAGELEAPRRAWQRKGVPGSRWASYLVEAPADRVGAALADEPAVHLMVVNAPDSCVFGGEADSCERVARKLSDVPILPIPYQIAAHVPEVEEVRSAWRRLHHLPTAAVTGIRFYTCATGDWYVPTADSAADAITAQGMGTIDFARTVERAWQDGVRIFIEHGPRRQCTGWISRILGDRDHLAVPLDASEGRRIGQLHQVTAELVAAGVPVRTEALTERLTAAYPSLRPAAQSMTLSAHPAPIRLPLPDPADAPVPVLMASAPELPEPSAGSRPAVAGRPADGVAAAVVLLVDRAAHAHRQFLAVQGEVHQERLASLGRVAALITGHARASVTAHPSAASVVTRPVTTSADLLSRAVSPLPPPGPTFTRAQLERLALGPVSELFGPLFAAQDGYARQTRMPAPPMLLADRVTGIDAEPGSMGTGVIRTETDVRSDAWYLDPAGRMSAGALIEAGQADLLLISWLGVDLLTRGERVYRLLGCELTFHASPPEPGQTLRYEIRVDGHGEHGGVRLFDFHYDAYIGDELRLSMRGGQAGFFTDEELDHTGGVLWDPETAPPAPAPRLDPPAIPAAARGFTEDEVLAFTEGRLADCFGPDWDLARSHIRSPRLGEGRLRLLHTVPVHDPVGGPWKRGYLRAETVVAPDDWFFEGHFPDDPCMPGTLMFDGCLQAMAFHLAAGGHTVERDGWRFEAVPGVAYPMVCRGQVTPRSRLLTYEVFVSELSAGPEPELAADVLCTVDGVRAFHVRGLRLRLVPDWPLSHWRGLGPPTVQAGGGPTRHRELAGLVGHQESTQVAEVAGFRYDYAAMLACAWGRPTEAFGPAYAPFDGVRRLARLPGPPFHFMSRVVSVEGAPWVMRAGSAVEVEYDVPAHVWYFEQNDHQGAMPFGVLMEVVLQASGWLASYVGSALTSDGDLLFRNLDGTGTVHREVAPGTRVLRTRTSLREVSVGQDMIIQTFDVDCVADGEALFSLSTVFGFFPPSAFDNQVGLPPSDEARALRDAASEFAVDLTTRPRQYFGASPRLPGPMLMMIDRVTGYWPDAGRAGLGRLRAEKDIDAGAWYFKAHFFQDPVQPGSLGVQAMCQLLQFYAIERGLGAGLAGSPRFEPVLLGEPVTWKYRGQVTPRNRLVTVELEVVAVTEDDRGVRLIAEGWLWADDTRIYHVPRFGVGIVPDPTDHSGARS